MFEGREDSRKDDLMRDTQIIEQIDGDIDTETCRQRIREVEVELCSTLT